jgi:hypothetical protein
MHCRAVDGFRKPSPLASILGAPRRIPLEDELFDLVIFDEASQCDIATAIPLFARAKRAVVVGDDKQLSFIPQLGQAQDRNLMQAQGLPIPRMGRLAQSRRSLFDFASRVPCVARVTLRHQYRSAGPIVEYISENFYGGQLATSYDPETRIVPAGQKPGISWENVSAPSVPQNGNVNPAEVAAITRHLKIGPVASGSGVLAEGKVIEEIRQFQNRDLIGLEMEIYGVYAAAQQASSPQPRCLAIKGVCDFADPKKHDGAQRFAAFASAQVLKRYIEKFASDLFDG